MKKLFDAYLGFGSTIIILLCSVSFSLCEQYIKAGSFYSLGDFVSSFLIYSIIFTIVVVAAKYLFTQTQPKSLKLVSKFERRSRVFKIIFVALIMVACWSPIVFMLYPGTFSNDTTYQLSQYYGVVLQDANIGLNDHHPIFDTLIFGWIISTASSLFGGFNQGVFTYVILQTMCTALAFSISLSYMRTKLEMSQQWCLVFLAMFCLVPLFPVWVTNISKDTLFSWLFVLFLIQFFEIVRTKGKALKNWKFLVGLMMVCILVALTKKLGVYIVVGSLVILLIFFRKRVISVLVPLASVTILMFCIMPLSLSFFGIQQGGKQEIFPLLFQQTARYVAYHADEVTEEERQAIDALLEYDVLAHQYNYMFADPVKDTVRGGGTSTYLAWLKTWASQGLKHPDTYLDAAIALNAYWFSFTLITPIFNSSWHVASNPDIIPEENYEKSEFFEATSSLVRDYYYGFANMPVLGLLVSEGMYVILLPAFAFILALKTRERILLVAFVPIWLSIFFLMLSPISTTHEGSRYLLPLVYSAPLILSWGRFMFAKGIKAERDVITDIPPKNPCISIIKGRKKETKRCASITAATMPRTINTRLKIFRLEAGFFSYIITPIRI